MCTPLKGKRWTLSSVRCTGPAVAAPLLAGTGRLQNLEGAHEGVVDGHHGAGVVELSAVVGGGEDGDEFAAGEELRKLEEEEGKYINCEPEVRFKAHAIRKQA